MGHLGAQRRHLEPNALVLLKHEYGVTFRSRLHYLRRNKEIRGWLLASRAIKSLLYKRIVFEGPTWRSRIFLTP